MATSDFGEIADENDLGVPKAKRFMKLAVESSVVHQIRLCDGISRVQLARRLEIAPSTIGIHVDRLVRGGFLREGKRAETTSGRPPTILELNPDAGQFIGVDLDAEQIRAIAVDFAQRSLDRYCLPIEPTTPADDVTRLIGSVIAKVKGRRRPLLGIGLAVPGTVDIARGIALHYKYIRGWKNLPIAKTIRGRFRVPVYLENNIRSMALAERWFGQGREVDDFLCIGIRSGIGSGLIIGGQLYRGLGSIAGEIGSWACPGTKSIRTQTLEEAASIPALLSRLRDLIKAGRSTSLKLCRDRISVDAMIEAAESGDPLAVKVVAQAARTLGRVIAQAHLLVNPQRVIIAGPLARSEKAFLDTIRDEFAKSSPEHLSSEPDILASQLDEYVGALGAAGCAVQAWQPEAQA